MWKIIKFMNVWYKKTGSFRLVIILDEFKNGSILMSGRLSEGFGRYRFKEMIQMWYNFDFESFKELKK